MPNPAGPPTSPHPARLRVGIIGAGRVGTALGAALGVTAPEPLRTAAEALVIEMGGEPVFIAEESRGLYHAALASAANHLVTLVVQAAELLGVAGVTDPARMLAPLLSAALDNALRL